MRAKKRQVEGKSWTHNNYLWPIMAWLCCCNVRLSWRSSGRLQCKMGVLGRKRPGMYLLFWGKLCVTAMRVHHLSLRSNYSRFHLATPLCPLRFRMMATSLRFKDKLLKLEIIAVWKWIAFIYCFLFASWTHTSLNLTTYLIGTRNFAFQLLQNPYRVCLYYSQLNKSLWYDENASSKLVIITRHTRLLKNSPHDEGDVSLQTHKARLASTNLALLPGPQSLSLTNYILTWAAWSQL